MSSKLRLYNAVLLLSVLILLVTGISAQKSRPKRPVSRSSDGSRAVLWEKVDVRDKDLFDGPGGHEMKPDLSRVTFVSDEKKGRSKKYRIEDGSGRQWIVKLGREARPETVAVRLLWGLGYKTEINYFVPEITIPGKGTFKDVRLEARPKGVKRLESWEWRRNPFLGTNELQGLKIMMVLMANWDIKDVQNKVVQVGPDERDYIVSDLGATFGRVGNNNLPIIFRFGRRTGRPDYYLKGRFVKGVKNGRVQFFYNGKNHGLFTSASVEQARWLAKLLNRISDTQIRDAFRAANYSRSDVDTFTQAVRRRIDELTNATGNRNLAVR